MATNDLLITAYSRIKNYITLDGAAREAAMDVLGDLLGYPRAGTPQVPIAPLPAAGSRHRIALCLGHGRDGDAGAESVDGTSEEDYNFVVLSRVAGLLRKAGADVIEITHYSGSGYTAAMTWLAKTLLDKSATAAVEFHFNAASGTARGHEVLHWASSVRGKTLAAALQTSFDKSFPDHPSRGLKPKTATDRGALFLSLTHCPAAIAEPFFGDNASDWAMFSSDEGMERLANAYAAGILNWMEAQP